jgi:transcription antitermination factor NusG
MPENWYAIKVFNNRIQTIRDELSQRGMRTYQALKTVTETVNGRTRTRQLQLAPSLLFVQTDLDTLKDFKQSHFSDLMVYRRPDSTEPAPIPEQEMRMFILVTSATDGRDVELITNDILGPDQKAFNFKPGEKVCVTEGPFKGAEGIIKRIKKDRKLLVAINGVVAVAISHVPAAFLERINPTA